MRKAAAIISASLLAASTASMAAATDGIYVGGKVGETWFNAACTSTSECDDNKEAAGLFLGYEINDYLGIEAGYDYLGKVTAAGIDDDNVNAFTLAPKFSLPIFDQLSAYLKAGGAYVDFGKNDWSYLGAAGLEYMITDNLSTRLEYQKLTDINNDIVKANNNLVSIGLSYKFGGAEPEPVVMAEPEPAVEPEPVPAPEPVIHTFTKSLNSSDSFALDSYELTESAKTNLQEIIDLMDKYPQTMVTVVGHTDSTGTMKYNQTLSEQRANAVAEYLEENGIDPSRVTTEGKGELEPVATNETREGREQNRRVDITIPEFEYQVTE